IVSLARWRGQREEARRDQIQEPPSRRGRFPPLRGREAHDPAVEGCGRVTVLGAALEEVREELRLSAKQEWLVVLDRAHAAHRRELRIQAPGGDAGAERPDAI